MPADYTTLAPVYDLAGMQTFAQQITPDLIDFAQRNGWLGRNLVEFGCGTGASLPWLARHHYGLTAVDANSAMLQEARTVTTPDMHIDWVEADIRETGLQAESADLVLALDVLSDLEDGKDLEDTFKSAATLLKPSKWLIFDLYTIEGLTHMGQSGDQVLCDEIAATVFAHPSYDYDRQLLRTDYTIFRANQGTWTKERANRIIRAYSRRIVIGLLRRVNLQVLHVLTPDLQRSELDQTGVRRIFMMAQKR